MTFDENIEKFYKWQENKIGYIKFKIEGKKDDRTICSHTPLGRYCKTRLRRATDRKTIDYIEKELLCKLS